MPPQVTSPLFGGFSPYQQKMTTSRWKGNTFDDYTSLRRGSRSDVLPSCRLRHVGLILRYCILLPVIIVLFFTSVDDFFKLVFYNQGAIQSIPLRTSTLTASSQLLTSGLANRQGAHIRICEAPLPKKATWFWDELLGERGGEYHNEQFGYNGMGAPVNKYDKHIRKTNMYNLGTILYNGLKGSRLWTRDCDRADVVFVNYDVGVERYWLWATNKDDQEHRKDSFTHELLNSGTRKTYLPLLGKKAHFMPLSKVEWDFKNCDSETARGFLCDARAYEDMIYWTIEKEANGKSFPHLRGAPYPAHIHLSPDFPVEKFQKTRDITVFGTWHNRPVNFVNSAVRTELANQCSARRLDCRFYENSETSPYDPAKATDFYRRSVFCIQPPSDMPLRSSVFDAAVNGCINVFLQEDIDLPFKRWIDWSDISLTVDYSRLKRENIVDILRAIPEAEIRQMQANIAKYRHGLQYSLTPQFDAVTFDRLEYFDPTDDALTLALKDAVLSSMELLPHLWTQPGKKKHARFDDDEEPFADSMRR